MLTTYVEIRGDKNGERNFKMQLCRSYEFDESKIIGHWIIALKYCPQKKCRRAMQK